MRTRPLLWLMVLLLVVLTALTLRGLGAPSLWFDEGWTAYAAQQPTVLAAAEADATNPPLYYMLAQLAASAWGASEFSLRLPSVLAGLIGVALAVRWLRGQAGRTVASLGGVALVSLPLLWWAMREARMYTLLMVLTLLALLAVERLRRKPSWTGWAVLVAAEAAALYTHNTGPVIVLWLNTVVLAGWIFSTTKHSPPVRGWIISQALVAVLWLPYLVTRFLALPAANSGLTTSVDLSPDGLLALWRGLWQTPWERVLFGGEPAWPFALWLALFALIMALRPSRGWQPLLHALTLTAGILAGLLVLRNEPHSRYLVLAAPFVALAYGGAVSGFRRTWARALLLVPPLAFGAANLASNLLPNAPYQHDDARAIAEHYRDALGPEDTVLAWSYADRYELAYYWDQLGVTARRVTLPEAAPLEAILPLLPVSGDVAINVWYTQRADYRGMLDCLIADGSTQPPEITTVHGMSSRLYRDVDRQVPEWTAAPIVFGRDGAPLARLEAHGLLRARPADRALCLPLRLRLLSEISGELKAAVLVLNALGDEITRADTVFATADQRTTAGAAVDTLFEAWPLLRLPTGTPPGSYRVLLRVYDEASQPSGFPPLEGGQPARGRDASLGVWDAVAGATWPGAADLTFERILAVSPDLALVTTDGVIGEPLPVLRSGDRARLTLVWQGDDPLPELTLEDASGAWSVPMPASEGERDLITRDWRSALIPADAATGEAVARLPDGTVIARWAIESMPMTTEPPAFETAAGAVFPGFGTLSGFSVESGPLSLSQPPRITLIWQAEGAASLSATVFAQILDSQGRVIAQSDALPAAGARPTTGWRAGEIIVDAHTLAWNTLAVPGPVRLIAGLYDAEGGGRVLLDTGADHVLLAEQTVGP